MSTAKPNPARISVRERILNAADRLFYHQGIHAVGVDAIVATAGVSKRTLYRHFGSKDELTAAYLARRAAVPDTREGSPLELILNGFASLEPWFGHPRFRGCPFVNAVNELGAEREHPAVRVAALMKADRRRWYLKQLEQLGVADANQLADQLIMLFEGAIASSMVRGGDPMLGRAAHAAALVLLSANGLVMPEKIAAKPPASATDTGSRH